MQHRLKYLEQEIEFYKKYSLPEVRESKAVAMNESSTIFSLIHQTLSSSENELSVSMMCRQPGFPDWLLRVVKSRFDQEDAGNIGSC